MTLRRTLASLLACALCLPALSAHAQKKAGKKDPAQEEQERKEKQAYDLYQQGITNYNLGEFDAAIDKFKTAYSLTGATGLLFNLAQAYRLKKDYEQALYFYKTYLRLEPEAPNKGDVELRITEMERLMIEQKKLDTARPVGTIPPGGNAASDGASGQPPPPADPAPPPAGDTGTQTASRGPTNDTATGAAIDSDASVSAPARSAGALGAHLRADVDTATFAGAAFAVGADYAVAPTLELGLSLLLSYTFGVGPSATYLFGQGALQPLASLELPIFFDEGVHVGAHPSAGVRLRVASVLAVQAELGIAYFFSTPERFDTEGNDFAAFYVVPSLSVVGRF